MKKLMNLIAVALCSICAQAVEFDYEVNWDGTIALTDVRGEIPKKLVIPSIYDGKEVTVIASHFLDGEDRLIPLESLVVSEGVLEIGHEAFADCPWLATVQLPASLKRVEEEAFSGGPDELVEESSFRWSSAVQYGLRQISVASGNQSIVVKDGVLIDVNQGLAIVCCVSAKSVSIPEGVTTIGEDCFAYCLNLETVEFPESLREVGEEAFVFCRSLKRLDFSNTRLRHVNWNCFCGCDSLREVRFPASLRQLGALSFCWCRSLAAVTFLGDAPEISDIDYDDDPGWRSVQANIYVTSNDDLSKPAFVSPAKFKASIMTGVTTYVSPESKGWGAIPGVWQGCPIQYIGSPVTPSIEHSYGPFVPGEKVSLMIPALVGYKAKKLPSGLKLNKKTGSITGAAKKPTGEAGVTVTFTKKNEPTLTAQFVVGPMPTINVTLEGDTEKCKVSGANKAYLVGKKVSLQAKAPKGTAFVGWFRDGEPWPSEEECLEPKIKYVMEAENLDLVDRFKAEEVSVTCDTSAGCVVKEQVSFPVAVDCESGLKSVSAKKLPSGLKYNKKTGCIEGAAKKAGDYTFSLMVTTKAGSKVTQDFALAVMDAGGGTSQGDGEYPNWLVGTFSGGMKNMFYHDQEHQYFICADYAVGTLTVSPTGKCTMKWEGIDGVGGENDYFKPMTFSGKIVDVGSSECHIRIIVPGEDDEWIVTIRKLSLAGQEVGAYIDHFIPTDTGEYELDYDRFVQNIWMRQDMKGKLTEIGLTQTSGFAVLDSSGLFANTRVTVSADGQVKLSGSVNGSSASATGSLVPCDADVGAEAFESYFIVTAGKWHYPVKILFVGQNGTWNVSAVDFDE